MSPSRRTICALTVLVLVGCPKEIPVPVDPPEARNDYALTALNTPVTLTPLLNDFDPTGETMTVVSITAASHGTAVLNTNGTVDYTPGSGYLGPDQVTVTIRDTSGWESSSQAYITVGPAQRMLFRSNYTDYFTFQLYTLDLQHPLGLVPVNHRIRITKGPDISHTQVSGYAATSDGINVIFLADDDETRGVTNLFHSDLRTPGISTRLTDIGDGQAIAGQSLPQLAADGLHAYYLSNEFQPEVFEIVQVEVANPANKVRINTPLAFGPDSSDNDFIELFALAPDGQHLLYQGRDADGGNGGTTSLSELRVVDLSNPGVSTVISGTPTPGSLGVTGNLGNLSFRFVPNSTKVVYAQQENGLTSVDIYVVDYVALTPSVKLTGTNLSTIVNSFGFTPDGTKMLYVSNEDFATVADLYMVDIATPGVSTRLSKLRTITGTETVTMGGFNIGQDNTFATYTRDDDTTDVRELYFVDFANPTVQVKLNHPLRVAGADATLEPAEFVLSVRMSTGAPRQLIYTTNGIIEEGLLYQTMYLVDVDSPGTEAVIGEPFFTGYFFDWMDDGDTIVHQDFSPETKAATIFSMVRISAPTVVTRMTPEDNGGDVAVGLSFY